MGKDVTQAVAASQQRSEAGIPAIEVKDLCKTFGTFQAVDHPIVALVTVGLGILAMRRGMAH